jgi:two-component system, NarL family, nitrate/nitrite response regulator NarL
MTDRLYAATLCHADREPVETVALVADRHLVLEALSSLLIEGANYVRVRHGRGMAEVVSLLHAARPAVTVVETAAGGWRLPVHPRDWGGRILLVVDPDQDPGVFAQAVRSRADGYLSRGSPAETFVEAVTALAQTMRYVDPSLVGSILGVMSRDATAAGQAEPRLSPREREILVRIANGKSTKEMAREYAIAPKTVCSHVTHMYRKLNLRHRGQLVLYAAQLGLTSL